MALVASPSSALPQPLWFMLSAWCREYRQTLCPAIEDTEPNEADARIRTLEQRFSENVVDAASAYAEMGAFFLETVARDPLMLVAGPEGVGKTTTLFRMHGIIVDAFVEQKESPLTMYGFSSYKTAREKRNAFNRIHGGHRFLAVVLPSFSWVYKKACRAFRLTEITRPWAAKQGFSSLIKAIERLQPKAIEFLQREHAKLWQKIGDRIPVFFSVHQNLHTWRDDTNTRFLWAPSRWRPLRSGETANERRLLMRTEMKLGLAVHDEVKADQLVEKWPIEITRWVAKMIATDAEPWRSSPRSLAGLHESFERFLSLEGLPKRGGRTVDHFDFDTALKVEAFIAKDPPQMVTRDSGEYARPKRKPVEGEEERIDIYEACHGQEWRVGERDWWDGLAHQTIVLTTEQVPLAVARATSSPWSIFRLEAPKIQKGIVQVFARRSVRGKNLATICGDFQAAHPETFIVSNRVDGVIGNSMPHITARGSNDLIGRDVMQTMTFFPPSLYEEIQVLNAWTGRADLVGLCHIDEFNQTAGRNLGFRHDAKATHTLLINRSLFGFLVEHPAISHSRYGWQIVLDKHQRSNLASSLGSESPSTTLH